MIQEHSVENIFGRYQTISKLAEYPSHTVYTAQPLQPSEEPVVLKVWNGTRKPDLFVQHARLLRTLSHPYILATLAAGAHKSMPYLVSDYAPNGSLRERLQRQDPYPLSVQEALTTVTRLGQALTYTHQQDMLHGGIKPENVLFNANNEVMLADFRYTSLHAEPISEAITYNENYAYFAPEQFTGPASQKSDQYALGCLAYEMLTGRAPFAGTTPIEVQHSQWNEPLVPPRQINSTIPIHVEQAILKALSLQPSERHSDMATFIMALHTAESLVPIMVDAIEEQSTLSVRSSEPTYTPSAAAQATPLVLPAMSPASMFGQEPAGKIASQITRDAVVSARPRSPRSPLAYDKKFLWLGACIACTLMIVIAAAVSLLKIHPQTTTHSDAGVITIAVNTQQSKHGTPSPPPRIGHLVLTPTAGARHASIAPGVAMFGATHSSPPNTINLSSEGTVDWVQWGANGAGSVNHKAGVSSQIGSFSVSGYSQLKSFDNGDTTYTWNDGTPSSGDGTATGVGIVGGESAFQLTIPASTLPHTLRLYIGVAHAQASFVASLSEKSSMVYADSPRSYGGMKNFVYIINYEATSTNQSLSITLALRHAFGDGAMVTLQAATLQ